MISPSPLKLPKRLYTSPHLSTLDHHQVFIWVQVVHRIYLPFVHFEMRWQLESGRNLTLIILSMNGGSICLMKASTIIRAFALVLMALIRASRSLIFWVGDLSRRLWSRSFRRGDLPCLLVPLARRILSLARWQRLRHDKIPFGSRMQAYWLM